MRIISLLFSIFFGFISLCGIISMILDLTDSDINTFVDGLDIGMVVFFVLLTVTFIYIHIKWSKMKASAKESKNEGRDENN